MTRRRILALVLFVVGIGVLLGARESGTEKKAAKLEAFATGRVSFAVEFRGELNPYSILAVSVMPSEDLDLKVTLGTEGHSFAMLAEGGLAVRLGEHSWLWHAPEESGLYPVQIFELSSGEKMTLNMFVLVPYAGSERLNEYRIGRYEPKPLRGDPAYERPRGFIEITAMNKDTRVSPHFKLSQFLCKQASGYPKYLLLRERMLLKLEAVLERVNDRGWRVDTLYVMSAFRTPFYNANIGNKTTYSRHSYGDASDIFVDHDGDAVMDDLSGDGKVDVADGVVLEDLIEDLTEEESYKVFAGGLHVYPTTARHGPMVHVDTRGKNIRW